MDAIFYLVMLILPLSALFARRLPIGDVAKMALAWIAIFMVGLVVVTAIGRSGFRASDVAETLGLSNQVVRGSSVSIPRGADGHFQTTVSINGHDQLMMIDTGATYTSISQQAAREAGVTIDSGFGEMIETANGTIVAQRATADVVKIGPIEARNLPISVAPSFDQGVVGMNFLSALESWRVEGDRMILEPRRK